MNKLRSYRGKKPILGKDVYIDAMSVILGDIEIGDDSSIWPFVAARGDVNFMRIGKRTNVQDGTILHVTRTSKSNPKGYPLIIGDDVTIGHKAMLHGCTLGNRILIGMSATIMDNAILEDDIILGAGSLVPPGKRLEAGYLYMGSPVKQMRKLTDAELAFLPESALNYVELKNEYLQDEASQ